jgi:hypothetical protein
MTVQKYKGYTLQIQPVRNEPNGSKSQTVLIFINNNFVGGTFAVIGKEDAVSKAKLKVDNIKNGNTDLMQLLIKYR